MPNNPHAQHRCITVKLRKENSQDKNPDSSFRKKGFSMRSQHPKSAVNKRELYRKGENAKYYIYEVCPPSAMEGIAMVSKLSSYETAFAKYCKITSAKPISRRTYDTVSVDTITQNDSMRTEFPHGYDLGKGTTFKERPEEDKYKLSTCESVEIVNRVVTSLGSFDCETSDSLTSRMYALPLTKTKPRGQRSIHAAAINSGVNTSKKMDFYQSSPEVVKQKICTFRKEPAWRHCGKARSKKTQVYYQQKTPSNYQRAREISARGTNILLGNNRRRKGTVPRAFDIPDYNYGDADDIETETSLSRLDTRGSVARYNTPVSNQLSDKISEPSWKTEDNTFHEWQEQVKKLENEEGIYAVNVKIGNDNRSESSHFKLKSPKNKYPTGAKVISTLQKPKISERKTISKSRSLQLQGKIRSDNFEYTDISTSCVKENAMQTEILLGKHIVVECDNEKTKSAPAMVKRYNTVMFGPDTYEGFEHRKISRLRAATAVTTQARTPSLIRNFNPNHFEEYSKNNFPFWNVKIGEHE